MDDWIDSEFTDISKEGSSQASGSEGEPLSRIGWFFDRASRWWKGSPPRDEGSGDTRFAPFEISSESARERILQHLRGLWFAPSDFSGQLRVGHIVPAYQPFWLLGVEITTLFKFEGNEVPEVLHKKHANVLLPAAEASFLAEFQPLVARVADWQLPRAVLPANPVDAHNIIMPEITPFEELWEPWYRRACHDNHAAASQLLSKALASQQKTADSITVARPMVISTTFENLSSCLIYLPLYISKYLYQTKEQSVVINAQTGSVHLERVFGFGTLGKFGTWLTGPPR